MIRPFAAADTGAVLAIWTPVIVAPPTSIVSVGMICGKARLLRLQKTIANCWRTIDIPIAVISGANFGACRNGR